MNINITDAMRKFQEERAAKAAKAKADFLSITKSLRDRGVSLIAVSYSGSGDSGQVDYVTIYGVEDNTPLEDFTLIDHPPYEKWIGGAKGIVTQGRVSELFEEWTYDILEHLHAGWEINDGADGTVYFNILKEVIRVEHNSYYTEYSEHEL